MTTTTIINRVLALVLTIVALVAGHSTASAYTQTYTVGSCRAYFQLTDPSAQVKNFVLNFDGNETDGITTLAPTGRAGEGLWYDCSYCFKHVIQRINKNNKTK